MRVLPLRVGSLEQLEHIAIRVASVGGPRAAELQWGAAEGNTCVGKALIFSVDIGDVQADVGKAMIADGTLRIARLRRGSRELEELDASVAGVEHDDSSRGVVECCDLIGLVTGKACIEIDLHAKQIAVESQRPLHVFCRYGGVVYAVDHPVALFGFLKGG